MGFCTCLLRCVWCKIQQHDEMVGLCGFSQTHPFRQNRIKNRNTRDKNSLKRKSSAINETLVRNCSYSWYDGKLEILRKSWNLVLNYRVYIDWTTLLLFENLYVIIIYFALLLISNVYININWCKVIFVIQIVL